MKRIKVSNNVIRRMPRYLRKLDELTEAGVSRISSGELGRQLGLTPSQIRQDFSCFGEFGQQGYGYKVTALRAEIASILGMDRGFTAILIGVGNIGQALMCNFSFKTWGFDLKAAFDIKPELIGTEVEGIPVLDMATWTKTMLMSSSCVSRRSTQSRRPRCSPRTASTPYGTSPMLSLPLPRAAPSLRTSTSRTACFR